MNKLKVVGITYLLIGLIFVPFAIQYQAMGAYTGLSPVIMPGTQVKPYTYCIWRQGSTYYATNGLTGAIDYSGSNETEIIINSVASGSKTILLKSGAHEFSNRVMMPSGTTIEGEGSQTVITVTDKGSWLHGCAFANENMMDYSPPQDSEITLANLKITSSLSSFAPIYFRGVHSLKIQNVIIEQFNGTNTAGIGITNCNDTLIENNKILNGGLSGSTCEAIYIGNSNYTTIKDNYIQSMTREGIYVAQYSEATTIESNIIIETSQGINVKPSTKNTIVSKNQILNSTTGIYYVDEASGTAYQSSICSNTIRNCETAIIVKLSQGITIANNVMENCTQSGIILESSTDCSITANTVTNMNYGIYLLGSENNTVIGNVLYTSKTDNGFGILLYTNSDWNLCVGNTVRETKYGIYESGADYNVITSCIARDCSVVNILLAGSHTMCNCTYNGTTWIP